MGDEPAAAREHAEGVHSSIRRRSPGHLLGVPIGEEPLPEDRSAVAPRAEHRVEPECVAVDDDGHASCGTREPDIPTREHGYLPPWHASPRHGR